MGAPPWRRGLTAVCAVSTVAVGLLACEPRVESGLSAVGVAVATDRAGSRALEGHGVEVRWLTCKADVRQPSSSPQVDAYARVDCEGRTRSGEDIRVHGRVTEERSGPCIHGDLTAEVDGRTVFRADRLGLCGRTAPPSAPPVTADEQAPEPPSTDSRSRPLAPQPTVTETVTVTPEPQPTVTRTVTVSPEPQPTVTVSPDPSDGASGRPSGDPRATDLPTTDPTTGGAASPKPSPSASDTRPEPSGSGSPGASPDPD